MGWTHADHGESVLLRIETVRSARDAANREVDITRVLLTKQQAIVLANYLAKVAGQELLDQKRPCFFRRLFG